MRGPSGGATSMAITVAACGELQTSKRNCNQSPVDPAKCQGRELYFTNIYIYVCVILRSSVLSCSTTDHTTPQHTAIMSHTFFFLYLVSYGAWLLIGHLIWDLVLWLVVMQWF